MEIGSNLTLWRPELHEIDKSEENLNEINVQNVLMKKNCHIDNDAEGYHRSQCTHTWCSPCQQSSVYADGANSLHFEKRALVFELLERTRCREFKNPKTNALISPDQPEVMPATLGPKCHFDIIFTWNLRFYRRLSLVPCAFPKLKKCIVVPKYSHSHN